MSALAPVALNGVAPDTLCTVTLRVRRQALAALQLLAIDIRFRSGVSLSRSAILRSLICWLEASNIDTSKVISAASLRQSLLATFPRKGYR